MTEGRGKSSEKADLCIETKQWREGKGGTELSAIYKFTKERKLMLRMGRLQGDRGDDSWNDGGMQVIDRKQVIHI